VLLAAVACSPADAPAAPARDRPLQVGFVLVDGVYNSELMAPFDIFHHTIFHTEPGMEVFTVSASREPVTSFEGLTFSPHYSFDDAPAVDLLVVPSAEHSMDSDLEDEALLAYVRRAGAQAEIVLSLCDGAFVLAAAGLLDGLECTTFPGDIEAFRKAFPALDVHAGVSFVHDGKVVTSAGGAVSYDAALYLCERLWDASVARGIGQGMVIDWDLDEIDHISTSDALP
jgi:transcriptional regulator GlxA family with amidase domain